MMNKIEQHEKICKELTSMYEKKNADYGDSFSELRKEFPESITYRLTDKLNRLKSLYKKSDSPKVTDESVEDTLKDIANYAILELIERGYQPEYPRTDCPAKHKTGELPFLHNYLELQAIDDDTIKIEVYSAPKGLTDIDPRGSVWNGKYTFRSTYINVNIWRFDLRKALMDELYSFFESFLPSFNVEWQIIKDIVDEFVYILNRRYAFGAI